MSAALQRREVERVILERLGTFGGDGWVTSVDIVRGLHGSDGRRVAGALRRMRRAGWVDCRDERTLKWSGPPAEPYTSGVLEYRITKAGNAELVRRQRDEPRLTDPAPRSWPRRVPHRPRHRPAAGG